MANKIMNAKEFFAGEFQNIVLEEKCNKIIEFTKLHVEAALKTASENATHKGCDCRMTSCSFNDCHDIDKDSILNSYPLNNIK